MKYKLLLLRELPEEVKQSDTLFILGSGYSVNSFSDDQWRTIADHDSVGFNFWLIHDFVPSFYVYEENMDKARNQLFYDILRKKETNYLGVPLIAKDAEYKGISVSKLSDSLKKQLYVSTDLTVGCTAEELKLFFAKGHEYMSAKNKDGLNVLLKKSGTLSYLIFLAEQMKYKKIVLCGIDLNDSRYFYDDPYFASKYSVPNNQLNQAEVHPTNQKQNGNVPITDIIFQINETILKPNGVELFAGSKTSALYPALPYYFQEST
jgi:hypothetical protein